jgi:hypothetical protein
VPDTSKTRTDPGLDKLAHYLDQVFRIPGTRIRFGLDPVLGLLLPGAGDVLSSLLSVFIIWKSVRYGIPKIIVARMIFNVGVDYLIGSFPLLGDLFDFRFKANLRNVDLLEKYGSRERLPTWSDWAWLLLLLGGLAGIVLSAALVLVALIRWAGFF